MKRLSNRKIRNICDEMITILEQRSSKNTNFLCLELKWILIKKGYNVIKYNKLHDFIPKFTNENAVKYANGIKGYAWWERLDNGDDKTYSIEIFNFDDRILFLKWLKEQYSPKKSFYKWLLDICNRINF